MKKLSSGGIPAEHNMHCQNGSFLWRDVQWSFNNIRAHLWLHVVQVLYLCLVTMVFIQNYKLPLKKVNWKIKQARSISQGFNSQISPSLSQQVFGFGLFPPPTPPALYQAMILLCSSIKPKPIICNMHWQVATHSRWTWACFCQGASMCTKLCACGILFLTRMSKQLSVKDFCIYTNKICQKSCNLEHGLSSLSIFNVPRAGVMVSELCVVYISL